MKIYSATFSSTLYAQDKSTAISLIGSSYVTVDVSQYDVVYVKSSDNGVYLQYMYLS